MRKFIVLSIVLLMLTGFVITSSATEVVVLKADQDVVVGTLTVEIIDGDLVVTYLVDSPWVLGDTHLYVGTDVPKKSAPGQFPYGPEDAVDGVYTIPLVDLDAEVGDILVIAAHAEVTNPDETDPITLLPREETAWANGTQIRSDKNWAMYFTFEVPSEE